MRKLTNKEFLQRINPNIEPLAPFLGTAKRIRVRCKSCGHVWEPIASNIMINGNCRITGCPRCAKMPQKTTEEFQKELGSDFKVLGVYLGNKVPIRLRHICGYEFETMPNSVLRRKASGCPRCENNLNRGVNAMRNAKGPEFIETHNKSALRYQQHVKEVSK